MLIVHAPRRRTGGGVGASTITGAPGPGPSITCSQAGILLQQFAGHEGLGHVTEVGEGGGRSRTKALDGVTDDRSLTIPAGFGQLEVPQIATIEGTHVLVFSCDVPEIPVNLRKPGHAGGVWSVTGPDLTRPFDIDKTVTLPRTRASTPAG